MDPITVIGLGIALGTTFGAMFMGGIDPVAVFMGSPSSIILVVGGTIGATLASGSMEDATAAGKVMMKGIMAPKAPDSADSVKTILGFADTARRDGLLALEDSVKDVEDTFLAKGIQMAVDGTDPDVVREVLETDLDAMAERHRAGAAFFTAMSGYAPAFGVAGTVIGLIDMLNNLNDPSALGPAIGVAFATTLWGVFLANYIFGPIATRLRRASAIEMAHKTMIVEGIAAIQGGASPRAVGDRLSSYLAPAERESLDEGKASA